MLVVDVSFATRKTASVRLSQMNAAVTQWKILITISNLSMQQRRARFVDQIIA